MRKYFTILKRSGLSRLYINPYPINLEIPEVESLINSEMELSENVRLFADNVTMNHKGLNWILLHSRINEKNYRSFIYPFTWIMKTENPCHSLSWQINSNARKVLKSLLKKNIKLSEAEMQVLNICTEFTKWPAPEKSRIELAVNLQNVLKSQYSDL